MGTGKGCSQTLKPIHSASEAKAVDIKNPSHYTKAPVYPPQPVDGEFKVSRESLSKLQSKSKELKQKEKHFKKAREGRFKASVLAKKKELAHKAVETKEKKAARERKTKA